MVRRLVRRLLWAAPLALGLVLVLAAVVLAQEGPIEEPTVGMLASAGGLAIVVTIVMNVLRGALPSAAFDQWAPTLAIIVGVVFAELYAAANVHPLDGNAILQALLVGLVGGSLSQNLNNAMVRAVRPPTP